MNLSIGSLSQVGSKLQVSKAFSVASPVAAIIVSLLVAGLVVWPKFSEVMRLRTANEQLAIRAKSLEEKASKLQTLDREQLELQLVAAEQLLPSEKNVFPLVSQIEKAAGSSGVLLSRLDVTPGAVSGQDKDKPGLANAAESKGEAVEGASKVQVRVTIGSDYKSFLQFLVNLLSISRTLSIKDLTIGSGSTDSGQLRANLVIDAYWQVLPGELPSIESTVVDLSDSELKRLEQVRSTGLVSDPSVPQVPLGRNDLFLPF